MKALLLPLLLPVLLFAPSAFAGGLAKNSPPYLYQDGVLRGFHQEQQEQQPEPCIATSGASESGAGNGLSPCNDEYITVYTVESHGATYILTPKGDTDGSKCGLLVRATIPHSVLDNQPPLTPIKLRSDGRHFFVRIGARESEYSVARVE